MYDATEPYIADPLNLKAKSTMDVDSEPAVYYTSVKKVTKTVSHVSKNKKDTSLDITDITSNKESAIVDGPAYDCTYARPNKLSISKCGKATNASSNIDVDDYGYNVTTQSTSNKRNLPTDNIYNRLA